MYCKYTSELASEENSIVPTRQFLVEKKNIKTSYHEKKMASDSSNNLQTQKNISKGLIKICDTHSVNSVNSVNSALQRQI